MKAYADFAEAVEQGYGISEELRPRITGVTVWFEYMIRYLAYDESILNTVYASSELARVAISSLTGYDHNLKDYNHNFNKRQKLGTKSLLIPKSQMRTLFWYFMLPLGVAAMLICPSLLVTCYVLCCGSKNKVR